MSIEDYEFKDRDLSVQNKGDEHVFFRVDSGFCWLCKEDVIALAKHFKLTEEDLK